MSFFASSMSMSRRGSFIPPSRRGSFSSQAPSGSAATSDHLTEEKLDELTESELIEKIQQLKTNYALLQAEQLMLEMTSRRLAPRMALAQGRPSTPTKSIVELAGQAMQMGKGRTSISSSRGKRSSSNTSSILDKFKIPVRLSLEVKLKFVEEAIDEIRTRGEKMSRKFLHTSATLKDKITELERIRAKVENYTQRFRQEVEPNFREIEVYDPDTERKTREKFWKSEDVIRFCQGLHHFESKEYDKEKLSLMLLRRELRQLRTRLADSVTLLERTNPLDYDILVKKSEEQTREIKQKENELLQWKEHACVAQNALVSATHQLRSEEERVEALRRERAKLQSNSKRYREEIQKIEKEIEQHLVKEKKEEQLRLNQQVPTVEEFRELQRELRERQKQWKQIQRRTPKIESSARH